MISKPDLSKAHIVVADNDKNMADVLWHTLQHMGLTNVTRVKNGREVLDVIREKTVDILITEWDMPHLNGFDLLKSLRKAEDPNFAMLPILMLTGRAEKHDVVYARDAGVTEFLVKPYSAKTLFNRLEHIIDFPRDFIVSGGYTGPDRRRNVIDNDRTERRISTPKVLKTPLKLDESTKKAAHKVPPEHQLRKKMGISKGGLAAVITPELLRTAQETIQSFQEESLRWIAEDLSMLEKLFQRIIAQKEQDAVDGAIERLLSIKSRAGTFDYELASQISFSLYSFLRKSFEIGNMHHVLVLQKHIEVLKIILARQVTGHGGAMEQELMQGLGMLREKLIA